MDMNQPDRPLGDQLDAAASSIAVDPTLHALEAVRDTASRRRRRRQFALGACVSVALVAGGVVAVGVVDNDEPGQLSIDGAPDATDVPLDEADTVDDATDNDANDADVPSADAAPAVVAGTAPNVTGVGSIDAAANAVTAPGDGADGYVEWLVPWRDGFLAGRSIYTPQLLPELPEEIIALFPPEVVEFFNGELPPTIEEATQMLSEAGLLDEVTAVLAEHPEASEAIYSGVPAEPQFEVSFTTDGTEWEPVEFAGPDGAQWLQAVQSVGDRLVVMSEIAPEVEVEVEPNLAPGPFSQQPTGTIIVASSTDLVTWDVVELPAVDAPQGIPEALSVNSYAQSLAANADGWVVNAANSVDVDVDALLPFLPADFAASLNEVGQDYGYGYGIDDDGIRLSISGPYLDGPAAEEGFESELPVTTEQPVPVETTLGDGAVPIEPGESFEHLVTWDDLGVDGSVAQSFGQGDSVTWAAPWGGAPVQSDAPSDLYNLVASSDGFYASGVSFGYSPDGVSWTTIDLPVDGWVQATLPLASGGVAVIMGDDGQPGAVYRLSEPTAAWEQLDIAGLPDTGVNPFGGPNAPTSATVFDSTPQWSPGPITIEVEVDGFAVTMIEDGLASTITVIDVATGDVVLDEVVELDPETGVDADNIRVWTANALELSDPSSGDLIVSVPQAEINRAYEVQFEQYDEPDFAPDLWLLATVDGERWLVTDLDDDATGEYYGSGAAAINGTTLLMSNDQQWVTYDLS